MEALGVIEPVWNRVWETEGRGEVMWGSREIKKLQKEGARDAVETDRAGEQSGKVPGDSVTGTTQRQSSHPHMVPGTKDKYFLAFQVPVRLPAGSLVLSG